jgi:hypothetical protein
VLVILKPGKKVPECYSSLRPSEKELLEWHSNTLHHKNTPAYLKSMNIFYVHLGILQKASMRTEIKKRLKIYLQSVVLKYTVLSQKFHTMISANQIPLSKSEYG